MPSPCWRRASTCCSTAQRSSGSIPRRWRRSSHGRALAGMSALLGGPGPDRIVSSRRAGLELLSPGNVALADELDAIDLAARPDRALLRALRAHLDARHGADDLSATARHLASSTRTL